MPQNCFTFIQKLQKSPKAGAFDPKPLGLPRLETVFPDPQAASGSIDLQRLGFYPKISALAFHFE